jgi:hypothetical protein
MSDLSFVPSEICDVPVPEPDLDLDWARPLCEAHEPVPTPEQQVVVEAIRAAYDRYFTEVFSAPGINERLRAAIDDPGELNGEVIVGACEEKDPKLTAYINEEMAKRGIVKQ